MTDLVYLSINAFTLDQVQVGEVRGNLREVVDRKRLSFSWPQGG